MKVLMLNGSANAKGCTYTALEEVGKTLEQEGIEYEIFQIGAKAIRDCVGCHQCTENGCVFTDDEVNTFIEKAKEADGFVFGTPVYYAHPSGRILSFLDRVFYRSGCFFRLKPAACGFGKTWWNNCFVGRFRKIFRYFPNADSWLDILEYGSR